ncbi:MAG: GHKL domain-containing protein [Ruminococcaceae bacterium]|nr:GHKL domain-containing protein [Oscillospiraceae bacterium]
MLEFIETTLFYLIRLFSSTLEMFFAFLLMNAFFDEKYKSRIPKWAAFVASSGILLALQETGQSGNIKTAVQMLLIFVVSLFIFDGKKRLKGLFCVVYSLFVALSKLLSYFAFSLFIDRVFEKIPYLETDSFFYRILSIELPNIFMFVIIMLLGMFTKSKNKAVPIRYWLLLLTVPVTTLGTLTVYQYYIDRMAPGEDINIYIIVSTVGLVFINVLVFTLFSKLQNQLEMRRNADLLSTQMRLEKESFKRIEESYNRTRELRHDLKNHIYVLKGITENGTKEEVLSYLEKMTDAVEEATYISMSGNSAVDAILNEKLIDARKNGVSTQFDITPLRELKISAMDVCTILSNALDNAVEACVKLEQPGDRYIDVKIEDGENEMIISVKNPSAEAPKRRAGAYVSRKKDKENHGLGLKSIKRTVDKHKGDMLVKYEDGVFNLVISLPY